MKTKIVPHHEDRQDVKNITSAIKDGKGGTDIVNRKAKTKKKDIIGRVVTSPRIEIICRVEYMEYKLPTNLNIMGDLKP
jgi:hypothetical protein